MKDALVLLVFLAGCQFELETVCGDGLTGKATGSIRVPFATELIDGETFNLSDGINPPTAFEFTRATPAPGHVWIAIMQSQPPAEVRASTINAINSIGTNLRITATEEGGAGLFFLRHDHFTSLGNQPITETVSSPFMVSGMSGGTNGTCPSNAPCSFDDECASFVCSSSHRCQ